MKELELIRTWNTLKEHLSKITDIKAKQMYYKAFLVRAINEWGFNPERPAATMSNIELTDWEQEFVEDIHDAISFGVDTRAWKREQTDADCRASMMQFVRDGGTLNDIPEYIRCESIDQIYRDCCDKYHKEMMKLADYGVKL